MRRSPGFSRCDLQSLPAEAGTPTVVVHWFNVKPRRVGIIAKNGGNKDAPEIDATFRFFELKAVAGKK